MNWWRKYWNALLLALLLIVLSISVITFNPIIGIFLLGGTTAIIVIFVIGERKKDE